MLQILLSNKVKFIVVGAYAMGAQGYPRATGDFDVWVEPSAENSPKVYNSIKEFGAPPREITPDSFTEKGIIYQIGVVPRRIDIITFINGVDFDKAYEEREEIEVENIKIPFLSKKNIIKNKESTGRDKDKLDVKYLKKKFKLK
ncbi:MAG: hypothetical protein PHO00_07910 [bacterium]|nr:hypothetical protein [bacterium]